MPGETETDSALKYKRVLLKISGEALMGPTEFGIHMPTCLGFAEEIAAAQELGVEICLVIGGGNIFRGMKGAAQGMERSQADSMGMLATIMNALGMQSALDFTTDTGAALRAAEMHCDAMFKGTQVDGVYSADPKTDPTAERYDHLTYQDVLARNLKVMDASAVSLMRDTNIPIVVFSLHNKGALQDVLTGQGPSTVIS